MQSFLKDANRKQAQDETVRNWISDIRAAARDAEDIIDVFLIKVESARSRKLLERCSSFAKRVFHRYRIGREIQSLRARLAAIDERRRRYRIEGSEDTAADLARSSEVALRRRLSAWQNVEHLVGVEEDVKKLLRNSILNEENKGLSFALVEGMGGIGKSTLARAAFDHREVTGGGFECRGWVVVSSEFNVKETIKQVIFKVQKCEEDEKKMLEKFQKLEETMKDEQFIIDELEQLLCKQLEGKTYFIVLDDLWEKEHLESLIRAFPNQQGKRSRVLVTSRNKIMTRSRNQYVHEMKLLDVEKGWELFLNSAFIDGKCPAELEAIGRKILEKCHGLPLAISVAGRLLVELTEAKSGWEEVVAQIESLLGGDESKVSPILELSYQYLSPHLKSCFLFLYFFKEDSIIETTRLVHIWTTHGLIPKQGNGDAIARGHLNELINRSMVQVEALATDSRVESCRLHDLLREVCIRRAKEEIGLEILKRDDEASSSSSSSSDIKPRHRVVYGWWNLQTSSEEEDRNKHLRSVFLVNASSDSTLLITNISTRRYWKSFELFKTLDLDKLPEFFRSLIGLKNLRIQGHPSSMPHIKLQLPAWAWFDDLKNLEVLDAERHKATGFELNC